ncbi:MAG: HAMP domain-containing sensor histidine kinase [Thermoproteota archaeon]
MVGDATPPSPPPPPLKEETTILRGIEAVTPAVVQVTVNAKKRYAVCANSAGPSLAFEVPEFKKAIADMVARGVRWRYITEITKENLAYCKRLQEYAELRHLDGVKGNFGVSETEYIATGILDREEEEKSIPELIYSSAKPVVEQQQYLFELLWGKAVPAEQKIREIEEGVLPPETRVLRDPKEIVASTVRMVETCSELMISGTPQVMRLVRGHGILFDLYKKLAAMHKAGRHGGIRYALFIDREAVDVVKEFLEIGVQVRHIGNMPPNYFAVTDKMYASIVERVQGDRIPGNLLISTEQPYIEHFRRIFEETWDDGIDAQKRIEDLESGYSIDMESAILSSPSKIEGIYKEILASARQEVKLILPSVSALRRQKELGVLAALEQLVARRGGGEGKEGVRVRLLLASSDSDKEPPEKEFAALRQHGIDVQLLARSPASSLSPEAATTTAVVMATKVIVDGRVALVIEMRDDSKATFAEAIGQAMLLTQRSLVASYSRMFETLWSEAALIAKLKESDRLQKEFINIAAHELRTPIQPILMIASTFEVDPSQKEETQEEKEGEQTVQLSRQELRLIARNARRLERLSSDILDVTRIESGTLKLSKEDTDLAALISEAVDDAKNQAAIADGHVRFALNLPPKEKGPVVAPVDSYRIRQVMANLLNNAIKFTEKGTITVGLEKIDDGGQQKEAKVSVSDTGRGIDPEIMPRLFQKFAGKSELGTSTGLGLYISKAIVEAHGGQIWAENNKQDGKEKEKEGKGATFSFTLPLKS